MGFITASSNARSDSIAEPGGGREARSIDANAYAISSKIRHLGLECPNFASPSANKQVRTDRSIDRSIDRVLTRRVGRQGGQPQQQHPYDPVHWCARWVGSAIRVSL